MAQQDVENGAACQDGQQIKEVGRKDSQVQGQFTENRLGAGGVGGNVKHVSASPSRRQYIDGSGNAAAGSKKRNRVCKASAAYIGAAGEQKEQADQDQKNVPYISMKGQGPMDMAKALRHDQCSNAA